MREGGGGGRGKRKEGKRKQMNITNIFYEHGWSKYIHVCIRLE